MLNDWFQDFGDVYGVYAVLTGEGYTWRDLFDVADRLKKQLILIPGVRKVVIDGHQQAQRHGLPRPCIMR